LRPEVQSLGPDLRKLSGQASSSADVKVANATGSKVCCDVQVLLHALQVRLSSEVSNAVGQLRGELSLVKADVARTSECLQHVEGEFRGLRARSANEQFAGRLTAVEEEVQRNSKTLIHVGDGLRARSAKEQFAGRLTAVEQEVQRNSKTLSHVGDILKVTHEITTGSDKMIGRMSYEVSNWREAESRLAKRLLLLEQMLHQLGSVTMQNAEQHSEMRKANEAEQAKDVELQRSAHLRVSLVASLGKLNETLQAPPPKYVAAGLQQQSPIGSCTRARSPTGSSVNMPSNMESVLTSRSGTGVQGGTPMVVNGASCPGTTIPRSPPLSVQRRSLLVANSGHSDVASANGSTRSAVVRQASAEFADFSRPPPAGIHPKGMSVGGFSVIPRQAALSATPVAHQA